MFFNSISLLASLMCVCVCVCARALQKLKKTSQHQKKKGNQKMTYSRCVTLKEPFLVRSPPLYNQNGYHSIGGKKLAKADNLSSPRLKK